MIQIIYKNIGDIIPYENNTKEHDKTQIDNIAKSIEEFGFTQPILIDKDNVIIAGHGRVLGALKLGIEQIPCVVGDWLTDEEVKKYRILDNKLNESNWLEDVLALEIEDIDFSEYDLDFELPVAFDESVLDGMFDDAEQKEKQPKTVVCPHCGETFEI